MHRTLLSLLAAVVTTVLAACGDDASLQANTPPGTAKQDCQATLAINARCNFGGNFVVDDCIAVYAQQNAGCRVATHALIDCVSKLTCDTIRNPNAINCVGETIDVALSCGKNGS